MDHLTKYLYEAKLVYYSDTYENKVCTFCMNPGGVVSYGNPARRTGNTNFASWCPPALRSPSISPLSMVSTSPAWATC